MSNINKEKNEITNEVEVSGRVVLTRNKDDGSAVITVAAGNGKDIFPRFTCPKGVLPELNYHAKVHIKGHVYSFYKKEGDRWNHYQRFAADEIKPETTLTEAVFGIKGKFFQEPMARIALRGKIKNIRVDGDWYRYSLEVQNSDAKPHTININMKKLDRHPKLEAGDEICCVCNIYTSRKKINEEEKFFESLTVSDIAKIS